MPNTLNQKLLIKNWNNKDYFKTIITKKTLNKNLVILIIIRLLYVIFPFYNKEITKNMNLLVDQIKIIIYKFVYFYIFLKLELNIFLIF